MSMSSKTTPYSLELFPFVKQLAGLVGEHGSTGFKSTYLHKSLPKIPTLVGPKCQFEKSF